jgi:hypothetical protein
MTEIPDCTFGDMSRALFALQEENKALRARLVEAMQVSNQHCFNHDKAARRLTTITEENETLRALLAMYETRANAAAQRYCGWSLAGKSAFRAVYPLRKLPRKIFAYPIVAASRLWFNELVGRNQRTGKRP